MNRALTSMHAHHADGHRMELKVVVASRCWACREARETARQIQERFPAVTVELIELDGRHPAPVDVVATPSYVLDGAVIALGTLDREVLEREIARRSA